MLVNRLGGFLFTFLAIYLTETRGYSIQAAGLYVALYGAGSLLAGPLGGVLADSLGRRPTMLMSACLGALAMLETTVLVPGHGDVLAATLHVRGVGSPALSAADMAAQLPALVRVRSDGGAEGSRWGRFRFVVTGGDRTAVVLTVTPIAGASALKGTPLKLAAELGSGEAAGLAVTVLNVVEKRTMEGNSMMRVALHLRRAGTTAPTVAVMQQQQASLVTLTSDPGDDVVTWEGFRVGYLGGWRTEVELTIVAPDGAVAR